jgi:hypothetical protein
LAIAPRTSLSLRDTLVVDIILGRRGLVVPEIVRLLIRVGKLFGLSRIYGERESLTLSSYWQSSAEVA